MESEGAGLQEHATKSTLNRVGHMTAAFVFVSTLNGDINVQRSSLVLS